MRAALFLNTSGIQPLPKKKPQMDDPPAVMW